METATVTRLIRIAENNCALWSDRLITRERDGYVAVIALRDEPNGTTRSYFCDPYKTAFGRNQSGEPGSVSSMALTLADS